MKTETMPFIVTTYVRGDMVEIPPQVSLLLDGESYRNRIRQPRLKKDSQIEITFQNGKLEGTLEEVKKGWYFPNDGTLELMDKSTKVHKRMSLIVQGVWKGSKHALSGSCYSSTGMSIIPVDRQLLDEVGDILDQALEPFRGDPGEALKQHGHLIKKGWAAYTKQRQVAATK